MYNLISSTYQNKDNFINFTHKYLKYIYEHTHNFIFYHLKINLKNWKQEII